MPATASPIVALPASLEAETRDFLVNRCEEARFSVTVTAKFCRVSNIHLHGAAYELYGDVCACTDLRLFAWGGWAFAVCSAHGLSAPILIDRLYTTTAARS